MNNTTNKQFKVILKRLKKKDGTPFTIYFTPVDKPTESLRSMKIVFAKSTCIPPKSHSIIEVSANNWFVGTPDELGYRNLVIKDYTFVRDMIDSDFPVDNRDEYFD